MRKAYPFVVSMTPRRFRAFLRYLRAFQQDDEEIIVPSGFNVPGGWVIVSQSSDFFMALKKHG